MRWPVGRLVWESRGHGMKAVSDALKENFPGQDGFSVPNIQRLSASAREEMPAAVAGVVLTLPIMRGFEEPAEIVRLGLEACGGQGVDPRALVTALRDKLPGIDPEVIARAIVAQLQADTGLLVKLAQHLADLLGFQTLLATLNHTDAKVDLVDARLEGTGQTLRRMDLKLTAIGVAACVGILLQCRHPQSSAPAIVNVTVGGVGVAGQVAQDGQWDPYGFLAHAVAGGTGERKRGRPMPHQPLPHQAVAPCQGSAHTLYGGCWLRTDETAPCPPDLYQEGNACYAPVGADPNVPVGGPEKPQHGQEESSGGRSSGDMPGRGEQ